MREVEKADSGCALAAARALNSELTIIVSGVAVVTHSLKSDDPAHARLLEILCAAQRGASHASALLDFSACSRRGPARLGCRAISRAAFSALSWAGVHS